MPGDDELYRQFLDGDNRSYEELMIRYGDSLTAYLNGYLHNWQAAEDLMIEAFARVMVKRPVLRVTNGFKAYLYKTARHLAARFHDRKTRVQEFSFDEMGEEGLEHWLAAGREPDGEREQILHLCLGRIDPELKEAIWLVYLEEMSYKEAAQVMGVTAKRIDNLLARGKTHLRRELEKEGLTHAHV